MSTKIYNGYRIVGEAPNLATLQARLQVLKTGFQKLHDQLQAGFFGALAAEILDMTHVLTADQCRQRLEKLYRSPGQTEDVEPPTDASVMQFAWDALESRQAAIKRTYRRDPVCDFSCEMTVHPTPGHGVLLILFAEQPVYQVHLSQIAWIEPFPYWDNTDPPDDVPEDQWDERGAIWTAALPSGNPGKDGLTTDLVTHEHIPTREEVLAAMPTHEERVEGLARSTALAQAMSTYREQGQEIDHTNAYSTLRKIIHSPEYQSALTEQNARITTLLPQKYQVEDLARMLCDIIPGPKNESGQPHQLSSNHSDTP